jgi:uncharacterized membrane protein
MSDPTPGVRLTESGRVETFSDGVFAIVITLLVLDLRIPPHEPGQLLHALTGLWGSALAFLLSFLRVGVVWLNHHAWFSRVRRVDRALLWMNLGLLATCMILPFPTVVLAHALVGGNAADLRTAVFLYTVVGGLQLVAWLPLDPYLRDHAELAEPGIDAAYFRAQRVRLWAVLGIDVIAIIVAAVAPLAALALWTLSLVSVASTSDGIGRMPRLPRRRRRRPIPSCNGQREREREIAVTPQPGRQP